jgi:hypothetical protein
MQHTVHSTDSFFSAGLKALKPEICTFIQQVSVANNIVGYETEAEEGAAKVVGWARIVEWRCRVVSSRRMCHRHVLLVYTCKRTCRTLSVELSG